jgi:hypothetical protein
LAALGPFRTIAPGGYHCAVGINCRDTHVTQWPKRSTFPPDATIAEAAQSLGNGSGVTAPDTVPLCLCVVAVALGGCSWRP